jgi:hypothetical protein
VATDGFRLHIARRPDLTLVEGEGFIPSTVEGKIPAGDFVTELNEIEGTFPNWEEITDRANKRNPVFEIAFEGKYLAEAVKDLGKVKLSFYAGENQDLDTAAFNPVKISPLETDGHDRYVVLMPCHMKNR